MSNSVYPSLPGLMFPVGRSVLPPPVQVRTTPSQREYRARDATLPRYQYSLAYEFLKTGNRGSDLATLLGFYNAVGGPFDSWLFLDPDDNSVVANTFGVGNGSSTSWQLLRSFGGFAEPVYDLSGLPLVYVNGVLTANAVAPYGSFEVDTNSDGVADGWSVMSGGTTGTVSYGRTSTVNPASPAGTKSQQLGATNLGTLGSDYVALQIASPISVSGSQAYTLAADCNTAGPTGLEVRFHITWATAGGAYISVDTANFNLTPGDWVRPTLTVTSPSNAGQAVLRLFMQARNGGAGAASVLFDAVQFQPGAATAFVDQNATVSSTGLVTFAVAPAASAALTWTGNFYRRCRFLGDALDTSKFMADLFDAKTVKFISVKS